MQLQRALMSKPLQFFADKSKPVVRAVNHWMSSKNRFVKCMRCMWSFAMLQMRQSLKCANCRMPIQAQSKSLMRSEGKRLGRVPKSKCHEPICLDQFEHRYHLSSRWMADLISLLDRCVMKHGKRILNAGRLNERLKMARRRSILVVIAQVVTRLVRVEWRKNLRMICGEFVENPFGGSILPKRIESNQSLEKMSHYRSMHNCKCEFRQRSTHAQV